MLDKIGILYLMSWDLNGDLKFRERSPHFNHDVTFLQNLSEYESYPHKKIIYISRNIILNELRDRTLLRFWISEPTEIIFNCTDGYNMTEANIIASIIKRFRLDVTKCTIEANVIHDFDRFKLRFSELGYTEMPNMVDQQYPLVGITADALKQDFFHKSKWFVTCNRNHNTMRLFKFIDLMQRDMLRWCHYSYSNLQNIYTNKQNKDLYSIDEYDKMVNYWPDELCKSAKNYWMLNRQDIYNQMPYTLPGEPEELGAHLGSMKMSQSFINAHYDSYFCCVQETNQHNADPDSFLPTEKIAKTMILRKPFLVYSTQSYLKNLRGLGFKTFGDFWDESYDNEPDTWKRAIMINDIMYDLRHSYTPSQTEYMVLQMAEITDHNHNLMMQKLMTPHYNKTVQGESMLLDIKNSADLTTIYQGVIERETRFMDTNKLRKPHPKL